MYCAEHKVTQESRLDELNIPRHQFYRWKKRYRESDEAGQTPEGGSFLQLTPGGSFVSPMMPPSRTSGKTKGGPGTAVAESFLTRKLTLAHPFDANRKHNLSITLPDFTSYTYTMEVIDNPVDFDYAAGISSTRKIKSFKSNGDPVAWHVQGFYNSSSDAETKSGAISTPSWIDAYSATNMSGGLNAGGNSVELSIKHGAVTPSVSVISSDIASTINSIIAGRTPVGTCGEPINLANPNNAGTYPSTYIAESANCYVVNRAGWYKIPLVMGNGVKNNETNSVSLSYTGRSWSSGTSSFTQQFRDYKNRTIGSPYLQSSNTVSGYLPGTPSSASVYWQDVESLVTDCSIMDNTTTTSGRQAAPATGCLSVAETMVRFSVRDLSRFWADAVPPWRKRTVTRTENKTNRRIPLGL